MDIDVINEFTLHVRSRKNKRAERAVLWLAKRPLQSIVLRDGIFWYELAGGKLLHSEIRQGVGKSIHGGAV